VRLILALALILATGPNVFGADLPKVSDISDSAQYWIRPILNDNITETSPALTIFYVDTVGWEEVFVLWGGPQTRSMNSAHLDFYYRSKVPILDTVIVGTVHVDAIPEKNLLIRKDK